MPRSPQDIYARHLLSPRGYPLWTPESSIQLLAYRRDGLRIGDVGVVIPEDGCFDVFFNICLPQDHPFHRATGVPDNFKPIQLSDMEIRTITDAENPGRIIATSSVKTVRTVERSGAASSSTRSSGLEYEFNLSSSEGALLILPEGAERHDLRNHHRFLEAAIQHGADWYRFAEEKVGQIIGHDSLYLITGMYKTRSWSLAAFEKAAGSGEYPAQCRLAQDQGGGNSIRTACTWDTTRALDWRVGPTDNYGMPNQAVFIRGFKIAQRTGMFGTKWISVKADAPSTRPNLVKSSGAVPGNSLLAYIFGGPSTGSPTESSSSGTRDEIAADPALDAARNEIQNNGALAVGKDVVIQRMPEASQVFHPSDVINQYLLNKAPSANIAVTHDSEWITLLEENLLRPEDLTQEGLLEALISKNNHMISESGVVYLRSGDNDPGTPNDLSNEAHVAAVGRGFDSQSSATTIVNAIPPAEIPLTLTPISVKGDITPPQVYDASHWTEWDWITESHSSTPSDSLDPQDDKVVPAGMSREKKAYSPRKGTRPPQIPDSLHQGTPPEQKRLTSTSSMPWVQPEHRWTMATLPPLSPAEEYSPHGVADSDPEMFAWRAASQPHDKASQVDQAELYLESSLKPSSPKVGESIIKLNPLLAAPANGQGESPGWIMYLPASQHNFGITSTESWVEARNTPATQPPLIVIVIICGEFPGTIQAYAQDRELGVTCGEVLDAISTFLGGDMQWEEYARFAAERYKVTAKPGSGTLKRSHWFGTKRSFGGLVENEALARKRRGRASFRVYELICL